MRKTRAYRRYKNRIKIESRIKKWKEWDAGEFATNNPGKFRKNNFSCNCPTCKPWKHPGYKERHLEKKVGQIEVLND